MDLNALNEQNCFEYDRIRKNIKTPILDSFFSILWAGSFKRIYGHTSKLIYKNIIFVYAHGFSSKVENCLFMNPSGLTYEIHIYHPMPVTAPDERVENLGPKLLSGINHTIQLLDRCYFDIRFRSLQTFFI